MYLLDTNVISELGRRPALRAPAVVAWIEARQRDTFWTSVVCLEELERGVLAKERVDPLAGASLRTWLEGQVIPTFVDRVLPVDQDVALTAARLGVPDPRPLADRLIAATARVHGLAVVTRNTKDFAPMTSKLIDPWTASPGD